jgi:hypothetical protein
MLQRQSIATTVYDRFYIDIRTIQDKNKWEAACIICNRTVHGTLGVTSNYNRHIKDYHKTQYESWQQELEAAGSKNQKKIPHVFAAQKTAKTSDATYAPNHPRQIQFQKSIVEDLIIELG